MAVHFAFLILACEGRQVRRHELAVRRIGPGQRSTPDVIFPSAVELGDSRCRRVGLVILIHGVEFCATASSNDKSADHTAVIVGGADGGRSEEHTSELQSLTNLVCRLLLEKKK